MNLIKSTVYKLTQTESPLELALFTIYGGFLLFVINSIMTGV